MPLKSLSYREVKRRLEAAGFEVVSQKESHVKFAKDTVEGKRTTIVLCHKEVRVGAISSILRQAELSIDKLDNL